MYLGSPLYPFLQPPGGEERRPSGSAKKEHVKRMDVNKIDARLVNAKKADTGKRVAEFCGLWDSVSEHIAPLPFKVYLAQGIQAWV